MLGRLIKSSSPQTPAFDDAYTRDILYASRAVSPPVSFDPRRFRLVVGQDTGNLRAKQVLFDSDQSPTQNGSAHISTMHNQAHLENTHGHGIHASSSASLAGSYSGPKVSSSEIADYMFGRGIPTSESAPATKVHVLYSAQGRPALLVTKLFSLAGRPDSESAPDWAPAPTFSSRSHTLPAPSCRFSVGVVIPLEQPPHILLSTLWPSLAQHLAQLQNSVSEKLVAALRSAPNGVCYVRQRRIVFPAHLLQQDIDLAQSVPCLARAVQATFNTPRLASTHTLIRAARSPESPFRFFLVSWATEVVNWLEFKDGRKAGFLAGLMAAVGGLRESEGVQNVEGGAENGTVDSTNTDNEPKNDRDHLDKEEVETVDISGFDSLRIAKSNEQEPEVKSHRNETERFSGSSSTITDGSSSENYDANSSKASGKTLKQSLSAHKSFSYLTSNISSRLNHQVSDSYSSETASSHPTSCKTRVVIMTGNSAVAKRLVFILNALFPQTFVAPPLLDTESPSPKPSTPESSSPSSIVMHSSRPIAHSSGPIPIRSSPSAGWEIPRKSGASLNSTTSHVPVHTSASTACLSTSLTSLSSSASSYSFSKLGGSFFEKWRSVQESPEPRRPEDESDGRPRLSRTQSMLNLTNSNPAAHSVQRDRSAMFLFAGKVSPETSVDDFNAERIRRKCNSIMEESVKCTVDSEKNALFVPPPGSPSLIQRTPLLPNVAFVDEFRPEFSLQACPMSASLESSVVSAMKNDLLVYDCSKTIFVSLRAREVKLIEVGPDSTRKFSVSIRKIISPGRCYLDRSKVSGIEEQLQTLTRIVSGINNGGEGVGQSEKYNRVLFETVSELIS
ncbi:hypothetical protein EJF18_60363 [Clavispora lusitaniae]|uniref:Uncharacterized protein n=1 Tax=Clavispora lusitaniae TaxID=36911 RepID=A0ACD0WQL2_CLALS|nr:hypothetical protein EJF14_60363 [Clavispora lusitaniae]QFZ35499.1 hypothetical protein EJF16_60363 [Clavispora lusitaniae]QFZ41193.1 hypothetical protein EJF15_60363 [Clavispora lusitaniae]QFZ46874.1 hypothetical protein EJF18_60363 [Clavispora lusitaniae]QFZ52539.1 hypothetical protein EJF17_60363 [Clavispora lusitaniae]